MVVTIEQIFIAGSALVAVTVAFQIVRSNAKNSKKIQEDLEDKIVKMCDRIMELEKDFARSEHSAVCKVKG